MKAPTLRLQNTLSGQKEAFEPINPPFVGLYVCGPTVYNEVHMGNLRTFISFDVLNRYLRYLGYKVRYVRNITDVGHLTDDSGEDRVEKRARLEKIEPMEIVQKYSRGFHRVSDVFGLLDPDVEPTATGHIVEQISMIESIIEKGFAYEANGSVYFDVEKYAKEFNYGQLSGRVLEELDQQTRNLDGGEDKRFFADFALWKKASDDTIMKWPSPWGVGVPGWHLECSAMSTKYLGKTFDIHGGGMDLKFPHHECEIAQCQAAGEGSSARYWMHTNMLTINGTKMSKSLNNSILPMEFVSGEHELLERGYPPMVVKFFMYQTHYSSPLDFSNEALQAAEKGFIRLQKGMESLENMPEGKGNKEDASALFDALHDALNHLSDDLNTPRCIASLFEVINSIQRLQHHSTSLDSDTKSQCLAIFKGIVHQVLGLEFSTSSGHNDSLDKVMDALLGIRNKARTEKNWAVADALRDGLSSVGVTFSDNKEGSSWEIK